MKTLRVIVASMRLQMKNSFVRPMFRFCLIANPIMNTILIYQMFRNTGQENFGTYVIMGAGLMALWGCICFSSVGDIERERWSGTLSIIFSTPASFRVIIAGKIIGNSILSLATFLISFVAAAILYGVKLQVASIGYLLLAIMATVICFIIFSTAIAYLLMLSRKTNLYMNVLEVPIILVCGFVIPFQSLPKVAQYFGYPLPPTWAVKLLRLSVQAQFDKSEFWISFGILAALTLIYFVASLFLSGIIDKQIRIKATLEVV